MISACDPELVFERKQEMRSCRAADFSKNSFKATGVLTYRARCCRLYIDARSRHFKMEYLATTLSVVQAVFNKDGPKFDLVNTITISIFAAALQNGKGPLS